MPKEGGEHERHDHDSNELYLICRGRNTTFSRSPATLSWLYESAANTPRFGHLHRTAESAQSHPVPVKPLPPDFPG
jgi:hypothetical protein